MEVLFTFCSRYLWFPFNSIWNEFKVNSMVKYPNNQSLIIIFPLAIILFFMQQTLKRYYFLPIGEWLGIRKPILVPKNTILEKAYIDKIMNQRQILDLARKLKWSVVQVRVWLYYRSLQDEPSTLDKFSQSSWRCFCLTCLFIYGLIVLSDKPWFGDIKLCYIDLSHHILTSDIWWFYMLTLAFSWLSFYANFFEKNRTTFIDSFIKLTINIALLHISWAINLVRIGSLYILVFCCNDHLLNLTKIVEYTRNNKIKTIQKYLFTLVWFCTSNIIYNMFPLYSTLLESLLHLGWSFKMLIMNWLLFEIYIPQIFWNFTTSNSILNYFLT